ncbi:MAG: SH3 domain-containing protein [Bacilli bacterium]|nr:SH3 domain-containing protein [Bacilli bacterium]
MRSFLKNQDFSKSIQFVLYFFVTFFLFSFTVFADTTLGVINGEPINFRSGPGTNTSVIGQLSHGTVVTIKSAYAVPGVGCNSGWINIYYNNKSGYVCKEYINIGGKDSLNRPWTTPKESIIGGALFTARGYISAGQNTSYLKKFNVNPNSSYGLYTHQYMANLAAPASESSTSYTSYKNNGLLNLPLVFEIPVFENMPEETSHPTAGKQDYGQSNVTDGEFEKKLDAEGFPESYKKKIRLLHNTHPNWIFKALKTGLQFNDAVAQEKRVSSVNGCNACYEQPLDQTEPGWYIANTQTVEYYLDPRNFIREERILMFEDLSYKEEYTATVVSSVLKGTFMDGISILDNQAYADIFVEAGRFANVSPVYLASLARQESGTKLSNTTNGARFTYKDQTYEGFYNFFNIGAYSSEANPALAGLVYASQGSVKNAEGVYVGTIIDSGSGDGNSGTVKPIEPVFNVSTVVGQMNVKLKGSYIVSVNPGTKVETLKKKTENGNVTFKKANGQLMQDTDVLGTGCQIMYKNGEVHTIVIYGDLTGDGVVNSADLLRMRQHLLGQVKLSGAYLESAKANHGSGVNSADLLKLRQHLLGTSHIVQG